MFIKASVRANNFTYLSLHILNKFDFWDFAQITTANLTIVFPCVSNRLLNDYCHQLTRSIWVWRRGA